MQATRSRNAEARSRAHTHVYSAIILSILCIASLAAQPASAPTPLLDDATPVDWWFVFKFNTDTFPNSCPAEQRACPFGGSPRTYKTNQFSQQFAYASSADHTLKQGGACLGTLTDHPDPVGATFNQIYKGSFFYVLWNDQFYGDPLSTESAPAGHSKGMLAWNGDGNGFVMQVTTPDWPGAGNSAHSRPTEGNTLGCIQKDNDILVSQHFFALKLNPSDVAAVLKGLQNASVVTDPANKQIVNNGGPSEIQELVAALGHDSTSKTATKITLSTGVVLISKPSGLHVPPWQLVSAELGRVPLRAATWFASPEIPTTTSRTAVKCWDPALAKPGAVQNAISGTWAEKTIGLRGIADDQGNHAKIAVSTDTHHSFAIFGDMNQQGYLSGPNCKGSQNGRGGLFYVIDDATLHHSLRDLIKGATAPKH